MKKLLTIAIIAASLSACSDGPYAERVLADAGYTDIHTTGYAFFGCGKDDTYSTGFTAKGPTGRSASGVVCSGMLFKGGTIRLN